MVGCSVLSMGPISDVEHATAVAGSVCAGLDALRDSDFWKIGDKDLLSLATTLERVGRLVYAAQVHLTGELDTRRVCERHAASSTAALLRQTLCISPGDAAGRVRAARAVLPRELPSGGESPPVLPELRAAVDAGTVGVEQIRTVVSTMRGLPAGVDPELLGGGQVCGKESASSLIGQPDAGDGADITDRTREGHRTGGVRPVRPAGGPGV